MLITDTVDSATQKPGVALMPWLCTRCGILFQEEETSVLQNLKKVAESAKVVW